MKQYILIPLFILSFALSSAYAQIKVMSYNTHYCVGMDGKNSLKNIAELIKKADPDIVGLQEISDSLMAAEIGRLTGMKVVFGPSLGKMNGYGDAILSKYPFKWEGNQSIPSASSSRYQAMAVTIDFSIKSKEMGAVRLINTHFDWLKTIGSKQARLATVDVIEEAFFKDNNIPTILTGDFNAEPDDVVIAKLKKYGWINTGGNGSYKTISSVNPTKQIDYIFYRSKEKWKVEKFYVMTGELSSDHLPVVADLIIK
ncbi:endonuclease/exonuclease/phosphatase family protein [Pedobacter frigoris]|uniref:endonuclease/exonuclease/phosphatase family protein n=1 Tax=Pedobacter frigoris TaxID=2571272 RepID=UPI00292CD02F|nr:endonuclease/exonuclease/phosphatase family protein [Pedobacter frigoris]